ncbi:mannose-1-phosphate guanylyltransferase [Fulvivirga sp. RKSG066]|uniref:mannose-1-phosphate guanylyltransferase n=1 Tax=Fulvivirga aurantia TaxID=2529383 RepID=UPI0012BCC7AA|nr:mannose-1-phosphate guanylyltransferase [Fulvivirga aurantia]MTI22180.1 mannose-1-phosphate guanylyltransferase [Fulvivirga aurantia]
MNKNNYVVIMAGGIGSRFWPYSRNDRPKQFLDILGTGKSLIQMTFERFNKMIEDDNIYVVTNDNYKELVKTQLPKLKDENILCEPLRRNTAPCIAYASHKIAMKNKDAVITVAPSDHLILEEDAFRSVITTALEGAADQEKLITIGLKPNRPETGFGYIQYLESDSELKKVKTFTEKPEKELAVKFIESGDFVWNSGIFTWGVQAILNEFEKSLPEMAEIFNEASHNFWTEKEDKAVASAYSQCANISIDFGVMEKAQNVYTVLGDFGWSDLGSWNSLHEQLDKDDEGNAIRGNVMLYDTSESIVYTSKDKLTIVQGLDDYLVAECDNVLLICKKSDEQKFRDFVADIKEKKGKQQYL